MSTAIVPYRPAPPVVGGIGLAAGGVACDLRVAGVDRRRALAACDVTVANRGESDVSCSIFGLDDDGVRHEYGRIDVSAGALMSSHLALPVAPRTLGRIFVEVEGTGVHLRGETVAPGGLPQRRAPSASTLALFVLIAAGIFGVAPLVHTPAKVAGTLAVAAPVAPAPQPAARIAFLSAHGRPGMVTASYLAVGGSGTLRVLDAAGTVLAQAPFSHTGSTTVALPPGTTGTLRAQLEVVRGSSRTSSAVDLPATAAIAPQLTAPAAPPAAPPAVADNGTGAQPSDPFGVNGPIIGGSAFTVSINRALPNLHIALQDEIGAVLDEAQVPPDATHVTLHAPATTMIVTNYLVGTYDVASTEQTLVRAVRIRPH